MQEAFKLKSSHDITVAYELKVFIKKFDEEKRNCINPVFRYQEIVDDSGLFDLLIKHN